MRGMRVGWVVVLVMSLGSWAQAGQDIEQEQEQVQVQVQAQEQEQGQEQQSVGQVEVHTPQERRLYKGALSQDVPEGNEGPLLATPYGGFGASRQAEITRIVATYNILPPDDPRIEALRDQAVAASRPCRWFGVGPERFSVLFGLECWTSLRR